MRRFAALCDVLEAGTAGDGGLTALQGYFAHAPAADAAWALYFLADGRLGRQVASSVLRSTACALAGIDDGLFDACRETVGNLAETISLVVPSPRHHGEWSLAYGVEQRLLPLRGLHPREQAQRLCQAFDELPQTERLLFVKLLGGGLRLGVGRPLLQRALAAHTGLDPLVMAARMANWPGLAAAVSAERFQQLQLPSPAGGQRHAGQPYAFGRVEVFQSGLATLGPAQDWVAEWKYDGLRVQVVCQGGVCWVWSREQELVSDRFPEIVAAGRELPDGTVLEGEIVVWHAGASAPATVAHLRQRISRRKPTKRLLIDLPAVFVACDLLETAAVDWRDRPQRQRRRLLAEVVNGTALRLVPLVAGRDWPALDAQRSRAREHGADGLVLRRLKTRCSTRDIEDTASVWAWKCDPLTVHGVLVYAELGHSVGAHADNSGNWAYTFAVWNRPPRDAHEAQSVVEAIAARQAAAPGALRLLPVAKVVAGVSDDDIVQLNRVAQATTVEKFGPVRSLVPMQVCELSFDGVSRSPRHKSGIVLHSPRVLRMRGDKLLHEVGALPALLAIVDGPGA